MRPLAVKALLSDSEYVESTAFTKCSRWAPKYRRMQGDLPYSLDRFPYVKDIMDSKARRNWVQKGAQTGLTETSITISLFTNIQEGRDVIYYFPTKVKMTEFSCSRIDDAIILSPFISSRCTMKNRDLKRFGAATTFMLGANSPTDLKSTSAGRLILDEFDEMSPKAVYLAEERTSGQLDKDVKIWGFSTPKIPDAGIDLKFRESTREHFFFKCPHCSENVDLWFEEDSQFHCLEIPDDDPAQAYYKCWKCRGEISHVDKPQIFASGFYASKAPDGSPQEPDPELFKNNRGFYVPQMYSPSVTPEEFAIKYQRGIAGDIDGLREFYNSALGMPFLEDIFRVTNKHIRNAKALKPYRISGIDLPVKQKEHFTTLGIDQGKPHYWVAVSWKFDMTRPGDANDRATGTVIGYGKILEDDWYRFGDLMRLYRVQLAIIDHDPQPTQAREFARSINGYIKLCMRTVGNAGREYTLQKDPQDKGADVVKCDKVSWLTKTLSRIMNGDLRLPLDLDHEFEKHLTALTRTMDKDRQKAVFVNPENRPDHYADALSYAELALKVLNPAMTTSDLIRT